MPLHESHEMHVQVIVEIDGHRLTFDEHARRVAGARYHGEAPKALGRLQVAGDVLEVNIRGSADSLMARAAKRANELLARMYPVAGD